MISAFISFGTCLAAEPSSPPATAVRLDGSTVTGTVAGMTTVGVTITGKGGPVVVPTADLLSLTLPAAERGDVSTAVIEFANGDRLAAEPVATADDLLAARTADGLELAIPTEAVRGILFRPVADEDAFPGVLFRQTGADDLVLLTNGDRLAGQFLSLDADSLAIDAGGQELRVPRDRVVGVAFSPELTIPTMIDGPRQVVQTAAGWLTVKNLARRPDGSWRAETAWGQEAAWPAGAVERVLFAGDRVEFLSDREPTAFEHVPFAGPRRPLRIDRDVTGRPLGAGGRVYARGLGTHSRGRVTYDLGGRYAALDAVAGLSASAATTGSVEFAVEVDGREVFRSRPATAVDPPVPVRVDLAGAKTLTLVTDYGRNGDILDRANWCEAALVRASN